MLPSLNEGRGVNPGDTMTTLRPASRTPSLNEGRGVNPGDTADSLGGGSARSSSLNEGRGVNPGDTRRRPCGVVLVAVRSTKAGA